MSTAAGPQSPPPAPEAGGPTPAPVAPPRGGGRGTWADMVRSMIVVLAFVALIVLLVPRPGQLPRPAVDVPTAAAGVESQLGFRPILPAGLPAGWTPTAAGTRATEGLQAFHIGYLTDKGLYAGVAQATSITKGWLQANDGRASVVGDVTIDGVTWEQRYSEERELTSLLLERPGQVVLVTTRQGGLETATVLARALRLPPS